VRVVLVEASGEKAFCAGGDVRGEGGREGEGRGTQWVYDALSSEVMVSTLKVERRQTFLHFIAVYYTAVDVGIAVSAIQLPWYFDIK